MQAPKSTSIFLEGLSVVNEMVHSILKCGKGLPQTRVIRPGYAHAGILIPWGLRVSFVQFGVGDLWVLKDSFQLRRPERTGLSRAKSKRGRYQLAMINRKTDEPCIGEPLLQ